MCYIGCRVLGVIGSRVLGLGFRVLSRQCFCSLEHKFSGHPTAFVFWLFVNVFVSRSDVFGSKSAVFTILAYFKLAIDMHAMCFLPKPRPHTSIQWCRHYL